MQVDSATWRKETAELLHHRFELKLTLEGYLLPSGPLRVVALFFSVWRFFCFLQ